jgi:mannose-6-phosphate isomerase-like protein (cupin superfamily)
MLFDYEKIEETVLPHFKGGEKEAIAQMHFDGMNRIMKGRLRPGASIGVHTHETSSEIVYIISGHGIVIMDGQEEQLKPGVCHYCPKGHTHTMINNTENEDLVIFAVVPEQ